MIEKDQNFVLITSLVDLNIPKIASTYIKFDPVDKKKTFETLFEKYAFVYSLFRMIELDGIAKDRKESKEI